MSIPFDGRRNYMSLLTLLVVMWIIFYSTFSGDWNGVAQLKNPDIQFLSTVFSKFKLDNSSIYTLDNYIEQLEVLRHNTVKEVCIRSKAHINR